MTVNKHVIINVVVVVIIISSSRKGARLVVIVRQLSFDWCPEFLVTYKITSFVWYIERPRIVKLCSRDKTNTPYADHPQF